MNNTNIYFEHKFIFQTQVYIFSGHAGACRWLLSNNADHTMLDVYGRTALDNARRYKNNPCIKVINNYQIS